MRHLISKIIVRISDLILGFGFLMRSAPVVICRPRELISLSRKHYSMPNHVAAWSNNIDQGFYYHEEISAEKLPKDPGKKILVFCCGGGREAVRFCDMGFEVFGIDHIFPNIKKCHLAARDRGLPLKVCVQDITAPAFKPGIFDAAWIGAAMYSSIPSSEMRGEFLRTVKDLLRPGGIFICEFFWNPNFRERPVLYRLKQAIALICRGNAQYEPGDILLNGKEFVHIFSTRDQAAREFDQSDFNLVSLDLYHHLNRGVAVLRSVN